MKIKFLKTQTLQVFGETNPIEIKEGTIFDYLELEPHSEDITVDIHLEDGRVIMYVPAMSYQIEGLGETA
jgi:hypothetical protein